MTTNQFKLTRALYDPYYAYKYWADYKYGDNTANITSDDYNQICTKWDEYQSKWDKWAQSIYSNDANDWYIDEYDFENFVNEGRGQMQDATGYNRTSGDGAAQTTGAIVTGATGALSAAGGLIVGKSPSILGLGNYNSHYGQGLENTAKSLNDNTLAAKGGLKSANAKLDDAVTNMRASDPTKPDYTHVEKIKEASADVDKAKDGVSSAKDAQGEGIDALVLVGCAMTLASGLSAKLMKTNQKEAEALEKATPVLAETKNTLDGAQSTMDSTGAEIEDQRTQADEINQGYKDQIEEQTAQMEFYRHAYEQIAQKISAGEPLNESEKELYKAAVEQMNIIGANITSLEANSQEEISSLQADMSTKSEIFDKSQEQMAVAQGQAEKIASFDQATKTSAIVTAAGDGLNVAGGALTAARAVALGTESLAAWYVAAIYFAGAAAAAVGIGFSAEDGVKQAKYIKTANTAIEGRKAVETTNVATKDVLDTELDSFTTKTQELDDLEIELPTDVGDIPTDTEIPESVELADAEGGTNGETNSENNGENPRRNPFL